MFKNLEWGINLESSTMYLSYEIDQDGFVGYDKV